MRTTDDGAVCQVCEQTKPATEFYRLQYGGKGVRRTCKACTKPVARDTELRRKFGITLAEYEALADRQGHLCAACGEPEAQPASRGRRLSVDLDPAGRVRGLVCHPCRLLVGWMENRPEALSAVQHYLTSFATGGAP